MKKSNIILITTSAISLVIVFAAFLHVREMLYKAKENDSESANIIELKEFSVLVAEENSFVTFTQSDTCQMEVLLQENEKIKSKFYKIKSDTLYIYTIKPVSISGKNIKSIISNSASNMTIENIISDTLSITCKGTDTKIGLILENVKLTQLDVLTENATVGLYNCEVEKLSTHSDDSQINFINGKYKDVYLNLSNKSTFSIQNNTPIGKMVVERDESSDASLSQ